MGDILPAQLRRLDLPAHGQDGPPLSLGFFILTNLVLGWTVVVWILLMINAFGYNPVPWV